MNGRLNSYLIYGAVAIAALTHLGSAAAQAPVAAPAVSAIATQMFPANALATVMIFPQEILSAPEMKMMPIEIADAWMVENVGVDLSGIQSLTGVVGTPGPAGVEFGTNSVTSPGLEANLRGVSPEQVSRSLVAANPELKWCDTSNRGYMALSFTPDEMRCEWQLLDTIRTRSTASRTQSASVRRGTQRMTVG